MSKITEETVAREYDRARQGAEKFMESIARFAEDGTSNEVTWGRSVLTTNEEITRATPGNAITGLIYTVTYLGLQLHNLRQGKEG